MSYGTPTRNSFLKDELRNIITALRITTISAIEQQALTVDDSYLAGYNDALFALGLALGLEQESPIRVLPNPRRHWSDQERAQALLAEGL